MRRIAFAAVVLVLAFVAGQLFLPSMAERRLRDELADTGTVERVEVHAFPALKILFHRADRVVVRMGEATAQLGRFAELLASADATGELDATATSMKVGPLLVRDLRLRKDGDRIDGESVVTSADLAAALPANVGLRPVASEDGSLVLEASAGFFGAEVALRARLSAVDGELVISADGPLGGLASLTVFSDPRVQVTSVGATQRPDGYTFTAAARLGS